MDNITHTLAGLVVADGAVALRARLKRPFTAGVRPALYFASALANNMPDSDLLYTSLSHDRVGYLLHHRGFTHTFVGAIPLAILTGLVAFFFYRQASQKWTSNDWKWVAGLSFVGVFLHIGFDSLNSYGVHPFWPFNNRWFYGDAVFIVEPTLWLSLLVPFFFRGKWPHRLSSAWLMITIVLCFATSYMPPLLAAAVTLYGLFLYALAAQFRNHRTALGFAFSFAVIFTFITVSQISRRQITKTVGLRFPGNHLEDVVLSPLPANLFCWLAISVETDEHNYVARRAIYAPFPDLFGSRMCAAFRKMPETADYRPVASDPDPHLEWRGEVRFPLSEIRAVAHDDCNFDRFLHFSRVPLYRREAGKVSFADLRFGWAGRSNFTQMNVDSSEICASPAPPWREPRASFLH